MYWIVVWIIVALFAVPFGFGGILLPPTIILGAKVIFYVSLATAVSCMFKAIVFPGPKPPGWSED